MLGMEVRALGKSPGLSMLVLAGLAVVAPTGAKGGEAEEEKGATVATMANTAIDEITVTATRRARPVFTTPFAVSVIDDDDITIFQPLSYADVFEGMPGVAIQGGARRISEEPSIRGFSDQQLVLRIDGARQNFDLAHRGRFFVDPDLVQRIEVVRGSASALYGSGAIGGVISLKTKGAKDFLKTNEKLGGRAKLGYQSNGDEVFASGGVFGVVGKVDAFANMVYRQVFDDLKDGSGAAILDTKDRLLNGLVKIGFAPTDDQRLEVIADIFDNNGANPTAADAVSSPTTVVGRDTTQYNIRSNYTLRKPDNPALDLQASTYFTQIDISEDRLVDRRLDASNFKSFGIDVHNTTRLAPAGNASLALTYGFELFKDQQSGTRNGAPRPQFPDAARSFVAGYAQAEVDLFEGFLSLVPGVRFDGYRLSPKGDFPQRRENAFSPRLSLGLNPTSWLYLWGGYAKAFRAPTLTELYNDGAHFVVPNGLGPNTQVINEFQPTPLLEPERARTFEAGARIRQTDLFVAGDLFEISGNYFSSNIENFVDTVVRFVDFSKPPRFTPPTGPTSFFGSTANVNIRAQIRGFEGELRYDSPYVFASLSGFTVDGDRRDSKDGLGAIPQDSITLRLVGKMPGYGLQLGGRATLAAAQNDVPAGSVTTGAYETIDLFASWFPKDGPAKGLSFTFGIDNVFNELFSIHPTVIRQPGRSLRLTLARRF